MRRAKTPINAAAATRADAQLAQKTGGRPLTMEPEDAALRTEWMDAYPAAGGEVYTVSPPKNPAEPKQRCPRKTWTGVRYLCADGQPIEGAKVTCRLSVSAELKGVTGSDGVCEFEIPESESSPHFIVEKDPKNYEPETRPRPPEKKPVSDAVINETAQTGGLSWLWGTVQGDFNTNPTMSQIVVNMVLGLLPVVDQATDVRDLSGNTVNIVKARSAEPPDEGAEAEAWAGLILTLVGCIPTVGSALEGVVKGAKKDPKLAFKILNRMGKGNAKRFLKEQIQKFPKYAEDAAQWTRSTLLKTADRLDAPKHFAFAAEDSVESAARALRDVAEAAPAKIRDGFSAARNDLEEILRRVEKNETAGVAETVVEIRQQRLIRPKSFLEAVDEVDRLDFNSKGKVTVLWSGFEQKNREAAEKFAKALEAKGVHATTLEMTPGGRALDSADLTDLSELEQQRVWRRASERFVEQAEGEVHVFAHGLPERVAVHPEPVVDGDYVLPFPKKKDPKTGAEMDVFPSTYTTVEARILRERQRDGFVTRIIEHAPESHDPKP